MPFSPPRCRSFMIACTPPLTLALIAAILSHIIHPLLLILSVALVLDAGARYREHIRIVDILESGVLPTSYVLRKTSLSWCRRHAAIAAGIPSETFYNMGYRWYHLFPKGAPWCFFKPSFYRSALS